MREQNAKERILNAALKVFAEKSFEGSRMDEISREAKVPKSLIYYHFKNKDEILEVLISGFISEYMQILSATTKETHQEKSQELMIRMRTVYYEFGMKNVDLVRVILQDSLKKSTEIPALYKILDAAILKEVEDKAMAEDELQERRVAEFFTSFIPTFAYLCFSDTWTKYFGIEQERYGELFLKTYEETHGAYHRNHK